LQGSTAQAADIHTGDELLTINCESVSSPEQITELERKFRAGSTVQFAVRRAQETLMKSTSAVALPMERNDGVDALYKTVNADGVLYRAIITKPRDNEKHSAVLLIGGLGCYSLDPMNPNGAYAHVLLSLTHHGFVTMRIDKSGEGDSEGPPCESDTATLDLAAKRSIAGVEALRGYDFVDPTHVFIFAHSLGPTEGALVVGHAQIRGFIAAETIGTSWFEYQLEIARSQSLLLGQSYAEVEAFSRKNMKCLSLFYLQGLAEADVVKTEPDCKDDLPSQAGMPASYFRGVGEVNLANAWQHVDFPVLVTYGNSDPLTSKEQSMYLVNLINSVHPGRATYMEFAHMSHRFDQQPNQTQALHALDGPVNGPYNPQFVSEIERWMRSN
jgi:alpha-beta hydrolase superfamily lysophospholipase